MHLNSTEYTAHSPPGFGMPGSGWTQHLHPHSGVDAENMMVVHPSMRPVARSIWLPAAFAAHKSGLAMFPRFAPCEVHSLSCQRGSAMYPWWPSTSSCVAQALAMRLVAFLRFSECTLVPGVSVVGSGDLRVAGSARVHASAQATPAFFFDLRAH